MNEDLEKILNDELEGILSDDIPKNYRYDGDGSKKYIKYVIIAIPLLLLILYFAFGMNFTNNSLTTDERMYEIYSLAASSGFNGTYEEWLDSISGADGANGENIELRINGTIVQWKYVTELDSNWKTLYSIADYSGVDGLSALELWIVANKFVGTEAQATEAFFDSLNVYGLWLAQGNKGSEEDFLNSLKGENGLDGVDVSYSVYLIYQSLGYTGDYNTWLDLYESSTSNPLPDFDFGFAKEEYEVKFEISGIIDSSLTQTIEEGKKVTSVDAPTKENYTFIGWFVGEEQWVFSGFTVTEDITLVAKFELTEYTIGYDLNGGVNNSSNPNTITYDDVVVLVDPTKVGYTFSGWTESNGELSQINSNITLTATWELATYEITYKLNDGVNNSSNPNTINYTQTIELVSPAKAGYEFVEWRNDYNMVVTSLSLISNDITLTAIWNETQFPITYELKGGTNAYYNPSNITINDTFILNDAIKEFYTFEGWYESELFTGYKVVELSGVSKDVTLWAKWSLNEYSVSYVNSGDVNNLEIITAETVDLSLNDATKTNYTFEGWYTESYFVNEVKSLSLDLLVDDEITLYANYSLSIYKDDVTEQEYVFYGSYPQTLISDISGLDSSEYVSLDNKYFKVEPIRWNIVMEENGVAMLISDIILDACKYDDEIIDFDYSYIKEFLNNSFYNTAFNNEEKENIIVQTNNTYTKVTLISNSQFETNKDKLKYNGYSDYSEVNNLVIHPATKATMYWTLSRTVDNEKNMHIITNSDALSSTSVITTTYGVRPTITINL